MTSGMIIREARLRARLSQAELGARVRRDRAQIARWESGTVQPAFETMLEVVEACGFELDVLLQPRALGPRVRAATTTSGTRPLVSRSVRVCVHPWPHPATLRACSAPLGASATSSSSECFVA